MFEGKRERLGQSRFCIVGTLGVLMQLNRTCACFESASLLET
ncbi:hypothetical protein F383_12988 [Gossypium arboreum]|uniref:Uncharacterized protein n=1 Tax=Gossypium arboreum TaxID=29729 RepID=A0A0B0PPK5_GOSAR|nr:hypothetical protein F383_12988 [Gossypium arboreum]